MECRGRLHPTLKLIAYPKFYCYADCITFPCKFIDTCVADFQ